MSAARVLVVDDEQALCELLEMTLAQMQIDTVAVNDLAGARAALAADRFDMCLTDMRLPDGNGIDLVRHIQERQPGLPVAVISAHGNMESAIEALKAGAFDFLNKPVELRVLRDLVRNTLKLSSTQAQRDRRSRHTLLGDSGAMREIRNMIERLARSQAPVYITGESGTGKELVARLIHEKGPRADGPFVAVNCGAIPAELMESEFFGHRKGSFTGATADKEGLFQAASDGTLFLDEVAELPLPMQVKLLRAIQEKAVRPVGAQKEVPVDVRILSASHKDLAAEVERGGFRQDLFYRIHVIGLRVPALRERPEDIPGLVAHTLARHDAAGRRLDDAAMAALRAYEFPGNVRELENIIERALALCETDVIGPADLMLPRARADAGPLAAAGLDDEKDAYERQAIIDALERTRYNKTAAARLLGITFRALRYRLKKLGLE